MDEIKRGLGELVGQDVETAHLDPIDRELVEQARVEIDREHRARAPDPLDKHACDRVSARADVQTAPALADANHVKRESSAPMPDLVSPAPARSRSKIVTSWPSRRRSIPAKSPHMPAPSTVILDPVCLTEAPVSETLGVLALVTTAGATRFATSSGARDTCEVMALA